MLSVTRSPSFGGLVIDKAIRLRGSPLMFFGGGKVTLKKLELKNYKGFENFVVTFQGSAFLVGPNNAGKSTIIQALRACGHMLDFAFNKSPQPGRQVGKQWIYSYEFPKDGFSLITENIRHEFTRAEAHIDLQFSNGNRLRAVWPEITEENESTPFFYLLKRDGSQPIRPKDVVSEFPRIGIVPTLMPIEAKEEVLSENYVRRNFDTRLSSRHFRNAIFLLKTDGKSDGFFSFVKQWTPEIELKDISTRLGDAAQELDLFFKESTGRTEKEICWSGDGLQIWLQFLLHLHRLGEHSIVILDEPDVYLHADLQRRLVRVLESKSLQTITATHSAEILGEVEQKTIIWVDRSRRNAVRAPEDDRLAQLSDAIGSQFNLRLARALRARAVVFFEGLDMQLLHLLANRLGAKKFAEEEQLAVIQLKGFSGWINLTPFKWFSDELLSQTIPMFCILDRDYRSKSELDRIISELGSINVDITIWKKKEIESYLLEIEPLHRLTGAPGVWISKQIEEIVAGMRHEVFARFLEQRARTEVSKDKHLVVVATNFSKEFETLWADEAARIDICPPKQILSALNRTLVSNGYKSTNFVALAKNIQAKEISEDVSKVLLRIERALK